MPAPREQRNRVIEGLRDWGSRITRWERGGSDLRALYRSMEQEVDVAARHHLQTMFNQALQQGRINVPEHNTLTAMLTRWDKMTLAERMVVVIAHCELDPVIEKRDILKSGPVLNRLW